MPKSQAPLTHRFIGHADPALCQKFFNIAKTEREAEIQPNRVADDFRWEAKAFVARSSGAGFHEAMLAHCSVMYQVDNTLGGDSELIPLSKRRAMQGTPYLHGRAMILDRRRQAARYQA